MNEIQKRKNEMKAKVTISIDDKEMNRKIDRFSSRISGKVTVATLMNMFLVLPEESRPSREYLKAYLKSENN